jgi:hypothetical protein
MFTCLCNFHYWLVMEIVLFAPFEKIWRNKIVVNAE